MTKVPVRVRVVLNNGTELTCPANKLFRWASGNLMITTNEDSVTTEIPSSSVSQIVTYYEEEDATN